MADDTGDNEFTSPGCGGDEESVPQQCSSLRKNGFVVIKGRPCRITDIITSKTGKHGHAKIHLFGLDIFNGKRYDDVCPSTHNLQVPYVTRREHEVIDLTDDGFFSLMSDDGEMRDDLKLTDACSPSSPSAARELLSASDNSGGRVIATVWKAMGEELVKELKFIKVNS